MVQRPVNVKTKASLKSSIMVQDLGIYYFKDYCPCNATSTTLKMQTQETITKETCTKEFRLKKTKPVNKKTLVLLCPKSTESEKIFCID